MPVSVPALCAWALGSCASGGSGAAEGGPADGLDAAVAERPQGAPPPADVTRYFPPGAIWYEDVSGAPVDAESAGVIAGLAAKGGFGGRQILVDFSLHVLVAEAATPFRPFVRGPGFYEPDCDFTAVPVPVGGALEGETGYTCTPGRDCHLIVHHKPTHTLYEMWRADIAGGTFRGGCLAVWDLGRVYGPAGRGRGCTSADAAGYPIAPLLFSADEVAAGEIAHAIRLVLPNDRIRNGVYLAPATHSTGSTRGGPATPPFGARLRLRPGFPVELLPTEGARTVARALQRFGMFLADGGIKALTAQNDRFTRTKWGTGETRLLGERDLALLQITDFDMVEGGSRIPYSGKCVRSP